MGEEVKTEGESKSPANSAYSKKSPLKMLLIYLVIGLLVYSLIYFFLYKRNQNTGEMVNNEQNTTASDSGESVLPPDITNVTLKEDGFDPQNVTIKAGAAVTWTNRSGQTGTVNSSPHPAHTDFPILNLGEFADGDSFSLVFDTPGTYKYHNHLDSTQFGSIVVE